MDIKTKLRIIDRKMRLDDRLPKDHEALSKELATWTDEELRQVAYDDKPIPDYLAKRLEVAGIEYSESDKGD